jgi:hypothetical protein
MAITPSMEKVMKVNAWDHAQMHVRRAALAAIILGVLGCTAHSIPSTVPAELPLVGLSALPLNSSGALLPDARTDGSVLLFDNPNRAVLLANFDLSDPVPRNAARPGDLVAPIGTLPKFIRFSQRGSGDAALGLPWVRTLKPMTTPIQSSRESPDRATDLPLTYYLDHVFDLTEAREQSMKAKTVGSPMLADDALYMMRQLSVESISPMTGIALD